MIICHLKNVITPTTNSVSYQHLEVDGEHWQFLFPSSAFVQSARPKAAKSLGPERGHSHTASKHKLAKPEL